MITAPRPRPTVETSLNELRRGGFRQLVHVFEEPGTGVVGRRNIVVHTNRRRLGIWQNWLHAARYLLRETSARLLLVCEDDIALCPAAAEVLEQGLRTIGDRQFAVASLYTPRHNVDASVSRVGWQTTILGRSTWGALAYCFTRRSLEEILASAPVKKTGWQGHTDSIIGAACDAVGRRMFSHLPSLVDHTGGDNSTTGHPDSAECWAVGYEPQLTVGQLARIRRAHLPALPYSPTRHRQAGSKHRRNGPARAARRVTQVGVVLPSIHLGGVEYWLHHLLRYCGPRTRWNVALHRPEISDPWMLERLQPHAAWESGLKGIHRVQEKSDVLLAWGLPNLDRLLPRWDASVVLVSHTQWPWTASFLDRAIAAGCRLTAVSRAAASIFGHNPAEILPCAVDIERCQVTQPREVTRRTWGLGPHEIAVGYVGRLVADKNLSTIAMAVERLGDPYRLVLVGDPVAGPEVAMVRRSHPQVVVPGRMENVGDAYAAFDVAVMASPSEGCPLMNLEAMYRGCPLVSTPVGVMPELAQRHGPISVPVQVRPTAMELSQAIVTALSPEGAVLRERAARIVRDEFAPAAMARRWTEFLCTD
jgi:glycosyltransferase involved in cell wall biosynthesis